MPEASSREISVPRLSATDRLVSLPSVPLLDARDGSAPGLTTALRLGWREDRLLLRFDCRHRGVVATLRKDNSDLWTEDVVEAFLSFQDPPVRYLELEVNPLGTRFAAVVDSPNLSREGMTVEKFPFPDFQAEVKVHESRWSAVLSIPLEPSGWCGARLPFAARDAGVAKSSDSRRAEKWSESRDRTRKAGERGTFRANFFRIDRTSGEFSALFPTLADPPDFHVPGKFGRFRLEA